MPYAYSAPSTVFVPVTCAVFIVNVVASCAPATEGSSVNVVASFVPLPSESYDTMPWLLTVAPGFALIVAVIVMVTTPPSGAIDPFHVTVLVPVFAAGVPDEAVVPAHVMVGR